MYILLRSRLFFFEAHNVIRLFAFLSNSQIRSSRAFSLVSQAYLLVNEPRKTNVCFTAACFSLRLIIINILCILVYAKNIRLYVKNKFSLLDCIYIYYLSNNSPLSFSLLGSSVQLRFFHFLSQSDCQHHKCCTGDHSHSQIQYHASIPNNP